jgi:hypothetical protein
MDNGGTSSSAGQVYKNEKSNNIVWWALGKEKGNDNVHNHIPVQEAKEVLEKFSNSIRL